MSYYQEKNGVKLDNNSKDMDTDDVKHLEIHHPSLQNISSKVWLQNHDQSIAKENSKVYHYRQQDFD